MLVRTGVVRLVGDLTMKHGGSSETRLLILMMNSGMLTLIATSPNIIVHQELMTSGFTGFGFFSFTLVGIGILVVAIACMLLVGPRPGVVEHRIGSVSCADRYFGSASAW
jgi:di/tricarboxylate transporter